jgi:hypothetical protein
MNMKKAYMTPVVEMTEVMMEQIVALSLKEGPADPNQPIKAPERGQWDVFGADEAE